MSGRVCHGTVPKRGSESPRCRIVYQYEVQVVVAVSPAPTELEPVVDGRALCRQLVAHGVVEGSRGDVLGPGGEEHLRRAGGCPRSHERAQQFPAGSGTTMRLVDFDLMEVQHRCVVRPDQVVPPGPPEEAASTDATAAKVPGAAAYASPAPVPTNVRTANLI